MDGWNGGRKPARGSNDEPTRAMPQSSPARPRAWSQVEAGAQPRQPIYDDGRYGAAGEYAPTQTPQPYRDRPYRNGGYRDAYADPRRGRPGEPPPAARRRRRRRPHWGRRIGIVLLVLLVALAGFTFYLDSNLNRTDALLDYPGRIADTAGTNWLLVGSDSRAGLTPDQEKNLSTGSAQDASGSRTDTIMMLHIPAGSLDATLVSIPRDSQLPIPGHGTDRVNAAFAFGGAPLLVQTVEQATKVHIDHYAEIGFGGFANLVDAVGGVNLCLDAPMDDADSGAHLPAGCQDLTGTQALGYVRNRHQYANQDLTRVAHQRQFLSALLAKSASAGTLLNPFKLFPLLTNGVGSFTVDTGDHLWNLAGLGWAMRGGLVTTTVPVTSNSSGLVWNANAPKFWAILAADQQLPSDLLTTTK